MSRQNAGAGIDRLGEFVEALEENLDEKQRVFHSKKSDALSAEEVPLLGNGIVANKTVIPSRITLQETDDPSLSIRSLTLSTPTGTIPRVLIENLTLSLEPGGRLLVAGPSGVGKSSLLRAIAGLWDNGSGTIARPGTSNVFFLPQKPYCTLGTLRQNMLYPHDERVDGRSDAALMRILDLVDLHELPARMGGFDVVKDWGDILSEGEKQRLNFGRLLLAKPTLAIIDEGSAALSIDAEARMYGLLETMGITVVSIGHRPSLLKYHDFILRLRGEGSSWELEGIKQSQKDRIELQTL